MQADISAEAKRALANPVVLWIAATALAVILIASHLRHGMRIVDIEFWDDSAYMMLGMSRAMDMHVYEGSGFYSMYFSALALFFRDPVNLFLWGGFILVAASAFAAFASFAVLSRSPPFALIAMAAFLFTGLMQTTPRNSFFTIAILAAGLAVMCRVREIFAKSGILLLTAFLATFVRPEFVFAFYALIVTTIVLGAIEMARAFRAGGIAAIFRRELVLGWACIFATAILIVNWSFPLMRADHRALVAFAQHFAVRYAAAHGLDGSKALWTYMATMAEVFPGAESLSGALRADPAAFFHHLQANAADLAKLLWFYLNRIVVPKPNNAFTLVAMWLFLAGSFWLTFRKRGARSEGPMPWIRSVRVEDLADFAAVLILITPPMISCIVIFPRHHYTIIVLYLILACCALLVSRIGKGPRTLSALPALSLAGVGLMIAMPVLPRNPQINLHDIAAMRSEPDIRVLYEGELDWCVYYLPVCRPVLPSFEAQQPIGDTFAQQQVDAVMVSPGFIAPWIVEQPAFHDLEVAPERYGFHAIPLPSGRILLRR